MTLPFHAAEPLALLAQAAPAGPSSWWAGGYEFVAKGGFFMLLLVLTSLVAGMAIIFKLLSLRRTRVAPPRLARAVEQLAGAPHVDWAAVEQEVRAGRSILARLCQVAMRQAGHRRAEVQEAVQASAREELMRLGVGLPILEVVITIAPMLGLLGTASGLVVVFSNIGESSGHVSIARGISEALNTTIAGLAIAVPAVVAHGFFQRRLERWAARLEVLLAGFVGAWERRAGGQTEGE